MFAGQLALVAAAVFLGAALYVNVAEQPARLLLDDRSALAEWKPAYKRGALMQASLALIGFLLGLASWWQAPRAGFLIGTVAIIAPWPWTLLVIKPVNDQLLATTPDQAGAASRALIVKWGTLHAVRTGLGVVATLAFLWALMTR